MLFFVSQLFLFATFIKRTELLLDDLEDLLLVELLGQTLDSCQSLTTIALLDANVDVVLGLLRFPSVVVGLREGVCRAKESAVSHNKRSLSPTQASLVVRLVNRVTTVDSEVATTAIRGRGHTGWAKTWSLRSVAVTRGGLKEGLGLPKVLRFWIVDINSSVP